MTLRILHLFPNRLGLNGESGNLDCLISRLKWAGIEARAEIFEGEGSISKDVAAVFVGSGTLAGAIEALELLAKQQEVLIELANQGVPFLALGLGWEILGESITLVDGTKHSGAGIYPSRSVRTETRASAESFGFDQAGNLSTGYANHSSDIELIGPGKPWITLSSGFGNSSSFDAKTRSDEGLIHDNLFAARLNGPLLPMNPHLADEFISAMAKAAGFVYTQDSEQARQADGFAESARNELRARLSR